MDDGVFRTGRPLRAFGVAIATGALLTGVWWAGPDPRDVVRLITAAQGYVDTVGPVDATLTLIGAVAWLALAWLAVGTLLATAVVLPGTAGRAGARAARATLPVGLRRLLAGALGAGVLVAAAGCGTNPPTSRYAAADWPAVAAPTVDWPTASLPPTAAQPTPPAAVDSAAGVTVVPGDTLWRIAADHLPPGADDLAVSSAATAWFSANQTFIGPDPDLIYPGLLLTPPGPVTP